MTPLFQLLHNVGIEYDGSNDNLLSTDEGFLWEVPTPELTPEQLIALVTAAYNTHTLGQGIFRGFETKAIVPYDQFTQHLVIYLSHEYTE